MSTTRRIIGAVASALLLFSWHAVSQTQSKATLHTQIVFGTGTPLPDPERAGSYRLYKGLRVVAYGLNLSNEVFGFYQGSSQYPIQREYYHPTFSLGMRWSSSGE